MRVYREQIDVFLSAVVTACMYTSQSPCPMEEMSARQAALQNMQSEWRKQVNAGDKGVRGGREGIIGRGRAKNSSLVQLLHGPQLKRAVWKS